MPDPEKPESVPPVTCTSPATKLVDDSLRLKVMVAVSPDLSETLLADRAMVGGVVSATGVAVTGPPQRC